jgi:hypothetical protein
MEISPTSLTRLLSTAITVVPQTQLINAKPAMQAVQHQQNRSIVKIAYAAARIVGNSGILVV